MPKISVIVPVYKAEQYLRRCLDSIVNQTFTDWECILVDDGSPDNSGKICDEYAENNKRFKVFHQKNGGVSIARQKGLDNSTGEYVIHTDPDDWVDEKYLEILYKSIKKSGADMAICDFDKKINEHKIIKCSQRPTSLNCEDIIQDILEKKIWSSMWCTLIKRNCFQKYNVSFLPQMNLWEDMFVICSLLLNHIKVVYIPKILYHYDNIINPDSIVKYTTKSHIISAMIFIDKLYPELQEPKYEYGWYKTKLDVKKMINSITDSGFDLINTYAEINEQILTKNSLWNIFGNSSEYLIFLTLKGHMGIARIFDKIFTCIKKLH